MFIIYVLHYPALLVFISRYTYITNIYHKDKDRLKTSVFCTMSFILLNATSVIHTVSEYAGLTDGHPNDSQEEDLIVFVNLNFNIICMLSTLRYHAASRLV